MFGFDQILNATVPLSGIRELSDYILLHTKYFHGYEVEKVLVNTIKGTIHLRCLQAESGPVVLYLGDLNTIARSIQRGTYKTSEDIEKRRAAHYRPAIEAHGTRG